MGRLYYKLHWASIAWCLGVHRYSRLVEELVELVSIPSYAVAGVAAGGRLIVSGLREGAHNLYLLVHGGLVRLNREPIMAIARPAQPAGRVVFYRDVSRGRELSKLYVVDVERPGDERELHPDQKPARILGAADDGNTVAFVAVTESGVGAYAVRGGRLWKAADIPGIAWVTDVKGDLAVGIGVFPPDMRFFKPFTVDLSSGGLKVHQPPVKGNVYDAKISPDGAVLYGLEGAREAKLYRLDPDTGRAVEVGFRGELAEFKPTSIIAVEFTGKGEPIIIAKRGWRSRVFLEDTALNLPEGMHHGAVDWNGEIAVTHTSTTTPPRIVAVKPGEGEWRIVLEGEKPWWLSEVVDEVGYAEPRSSVDGSPVPTVYLASRRAGKPGPTVVLVHGGPFAEAADRWNDLAIALAAAGFNVVEPNYRGSTGYGVEWTEKIIGDPCGAELEDILSAAKWALDSGLASRIYIAGYSYGGYMTLCALTRKPGFFRGGVAGASVADWEEMYQLSDPAFKQFIEMLFAGRKELWKERSPITYIDQLREPLAIIHPLNDSRTPLKPVLRFIEKAAEKGKNIEAHIAPDMGHVINTVEDAIKILLPALLYLAKLEEKTGKA